MICPRCGTESEGDVCAHCGARLETTLNSDSQPIAPTPSKSHWYTNRALYGGFLLVISALFCVFFFIIQDYELSTIEGWIITLGLAMVAFRLIAKATRQGSTMGGILLCPACALILIYCYFLIVVGIFT